MGDRANMTVAAKPGRLLMRVSRAARSSDLAFVYRDAAMATSDMMTGRLEAMLGKKVDHSTCEP